MTLISLVRSARPALVLALLLPSLPARAVTQPGGQVIPVIISPGAACTSGLNVQACLDDSEVTMGGTAGAVGAIANASINQETFDPTCQLTFKVLSKGGSFYQHAFGWYPVRAGNVPPPLNQLHAFLTCMDAQTPGTTKTLTLPPGTGKIGFFMASYSGACGMVAADGTLASEPLYTFYTERRFNGLNRTGAPITGVPPNVIRVLTWQSTAQPGAFYFGWEDDGVSSDDNFNDLVTRVGGISCAGGGASCDTGMKGACARGTMQCRNGMLTCVPDQGPVAESCNAVDDNCDGTVDEGDKLCPPQLTCYRGNCVLGCLDIEVYHCAAGFECDKTFSPNGICIETACKTVTCPPGQLCRGGMCRGECEGIICPWGQACRHGGCVDVCAGLTCDALSRCLVRYPGGDPANAVGVCTTCPCGGCPGGMTCASNACVPNDCATVACMPGTHCMGGACVDNCVGAKCPPGFACDKGQCQMMGGGPGGPDGGAGNDGGRGGADAGGTVTRPDGAADGGGPAFVGRSVGCGCRLPDLDGGAGWLAPLGLALLALARRRPACRARSSRR